MAKEVMRVIGKSVPITEARDKVTGRSKFVDDMKAELCAKILGSPHPHTQIKSIDISRAKALPGVEAVLTHKDVSNMLIPFRRYRPCYPIDEHLRYVGDYVAAVAAINEAVAEEALDLIDVEYEVLPAVFDPEEAAKPTAPKIYPEGNICGPQDQPKIIEWGDIEKGFAEADAIVEDHFDVTPQMHAAIEPHVCMARWKDDRLTIWCAIHCPWELRQIVAHVFEIPESNIVVLSKNVGGGFGGKYVGRHQIITCLLSRMAGGRLTKLTFTREEAHRYARRPRGKLYAKMGAKKDGTITALHVGGYFDIGAHERHYAPFITHLSYGIGSYKTQNARFESYAVNTNHFHAQAMRSVSAPFFAFAMESIIEEVAEKLKLDPVDIRLKNMPESGDIMPPTPFVNNSAGCKRARLDIYPGKKMLTEVLEKVDWKRKWRGFGKPTEVSGAKRKGIGLAYMQEHCGYSAESTASMQVVINRDGSVITHSGAQEIGQGINTTLRMLAAESLGVSLDDVAIFTGDTRTGQYDFINARSSRQLATDGHLLLMAVEEAKKKIREIVAPVFKVKSDLIEVSGKQAYPKGDPQKAKHLRDLLSTTVTGTATGRPGSLLPEVKPGFRPFQPLAVAVEIEVDTETGTVRPLKLVTGMFPGRMINKGIVRGQAIGGMIQSLGMALWEELKYDEKAAMYLSKDFTDYKIPHSMDIPEVDTVLLEEVDEDSPYYEGLPYGGRGIGELGCWGVPVAIANAIYNATGVRVKKSPATAETVLEALGKEIPDKSTGNHEKA